ncbi:MAG: Na+/H+ antiporter subunit E, partial [Planctomycetota bacterium]
MNLLGQLLAIAIGWCLLMGAFTPGQFLLGTLLGLLVLVLTRQVTGAGRVLGQMWAVVHLVIVVSKDLVVSSLRVAWDVCTPTPLARPRIIAIPVAGMDPVELTVLANAITLTPGTLSLDVA